MKFAAASFLEFLGPLSGGSIGIVDHRYLGKGRVLDGIDNLFKPADHIVAIGNFAALIANLRRHIFDDDDTSAYIGSKSGKTVLCFALAHKADHGISSGNYTMKKKRCP
jgi:hypothetical protein